MPKYRIDPNEIPDDVAWTEHSGTPYDVHYACSMNAEVDVVERNVTIVRVVNCNTTDHVDMTSPTGRAIIRGVMPDILESAMNTLDEIGDF